MYAFARCSPRGTPLDSLMRMTNPSLSAALSQKTAQEHAAFDPDASRTERVDWMAGVVADLQVLKALNTSEWRLRPLVGLMAFSAMTGAMLAALAFGLAWWWWYLPATLSAVMLVLLLRESLFVSPRRRAMLVIGKLAVTIAPLRPTMSELQEALSVSFVNDNQLGRDIRAGDLAREVALARASRRTP